MTRIICMCLVLCLSSISGWAQNTDSGNTDSGNHDANTHSQIQNPGNNTTDANTSPNDSMPASENTTSHSSQQANQTEQTSEDGVGSEEDLDLSQLNNVVIFDQPDFEGRYQILEYEAYSLYDMALDNDSISSVFVPEGYIVVLYEHDSYEGESRVLQSSASTLDDFNNLVSSIKIYNKDSPLIYIYEEPNYQGQLYILNMDYHYSSYELDSFSNSFGSIKIPEGKVIIIRDDYRDFMQPLFIHKSSAETITIPFVDYYLSFDTLENLKKTHLMIFTEPNYEGELQILYNGRYDAEELTIGEDTVSSVLVPEAMRVKLYEDPGYDGERMDIETNVPDLGEFSNKTSSLRVYNYQPEFIISTTMIDHESYEAALLHSSGVAGYFSDDFQSSFYFGYQLALGVGAGWGRPGRFYTPPMLHYTGAGFNAMGEMMIAYGVDPWKGNHRFIARLRGDAFGGISIAQTSAVFPIGYIGGGLGLMNTQISIDTGRSRFFQGTFIPSLVMPMPFIIRNKAVLFTVLYLGIDITSTENYLEHLHDGASWSLALGLKFRFIYKKRLLLSFGYEGDHDVHIRDASDARVRLGPRHDLSFDARIFRIFGHTGSLYFSGGYSKFVDPTFGDAFFGEFGTGIVW